MNIISASRRTDIPKYYSQWFINRIKEGFAFYQTPFSSRIYSVSLKPEDVHAIVFWTRDASPLFSYIPELEEKYKFVFHFTITGMPSPSVFEPNSLPKEEAISIFKTLASKIGSHRVFLRFDPILLSNITPSKSYLQQFEILTSKLKGFTKKCYFSFTSFYKKVQRRIKEYLEIRGIYCYEPDIYEKKEICKSLCEIANYNGMELYICCEDSLVGNGIKKASCIGEYINELFPEKAQHHKYSPTREGCGCIESKDIGMVNTCIGGCIYCYANTVQTVAEYNYKIHKVTNPSIV